MSLAYYLVLFPIPPRFFSIKIPGFPEILGFLHQRYQRLYLLWSKPFELFHNVCVVIQLQEPRVKLHLLGKREGIYVAVGDVVVHRMAHAL